jgi:hypothetical protein
MTMVICNECKAQTSTLAVACLQCGASKRKAPDSTVVAIAFLGLAVLVNSWMLWRLYDHEPHAAGNEIAQRAPDSQ